MTPSARASLIDDYAQTSLGHEGVGQLIDDEWNKHRRKTEDRILDNEPARAESAGARFALTPQGLLDAVASIGGQLGVSMSTGHPVCRLPGSQRVLACDRSSDGRELLLHHVETTCNDLTGRPWRIMAARDENRLVVNAANLGGAVTTDEDARDMADIVEAMQAEKRRYLRHCDIWIAAGKLDRNRAERNIAKRAYRLIDAAAIELGWGEFKKRRVPGLSYPAWRFENSAAVENTDAGSRETTTARALRLVK